MAKPTTNMDSYVVPPSEPHTWLPTSSCCPQSRASPDLDPDLQLQAGLRAQHAGMAAGTGHGDHPHADQDAGIGLGTWCQWGEGPPPPPVCPPHQDPRPSAHSTKSSGPTEAQVVSVCSSGRGHVSWGGPARVMATMGAEK